MGWQDRDYHREQGSYGGRGGAGFGRPGHSAVMWLLGINCAIFLLDGILASSQRGSTFAPGELGAFTVEKGLYGVQVWRWITYQFLHDGLWHILMNMVVLYFFGRLMEQWWGSRRFLAFYLLCGMSGAVLFTIIVLIAPGLIVNVVTLENWGLTPAQVPVIGASGAIFGILAGCAVLYPHLRVMLMFPPIPMSMRTMALLFLGIAALSVIVGSQNAGGEAAHLGGAALGFLLVKNPSLLNWATRRIQFGGAGRGARSAKSARPKDDPDGAKVDRILTKVKEHGLHSLTRSEKKTLQRATDRKQDAGGRAGRD